MDEAINKPTIIQTMEKGSETDDPTAMKQKQLRANVAAALTGVVTYFVKKYYPDFPIFQYQDILTAIFFSAVGLINYYFTVASSKKIGIMG